MEALPRTSNRMQRSSSMTLLRRRISRTFSRRRDPKSNFDQPAPSTIKRSRSAAFRPIQINNGSTPKRSMSMGLKRKLSSHLPSNPYIYVPSDPAASKDSDSVPLLRRVSKIARTRSVRRSQSENTPGPKKRYRTQGSPRNLQTIQGAKQFVKIPVAIQEEITVRKVTPPPGGPPQSSSASSSSPSSITFTDPEKIKNNDSANTQGEMVVTLTAEEKELLEKRTRRKKVVWYAPVVDAWKRMQSECPYCTENGECWAGSIIYG